MHALIASFLAADICLKLFPVLFMLGQPSTKVVLDLDAACGLYCEDTLYMQVLERTATFGGQTTSCTSFT